jgi:hypothetical protein
MLSIIGAYFHVGPILLWDGNSPPLWMRKWLLLHHYLLALLRLLLSKLSLFLLGNAQQTQRP